MKTPENSSGSLLELREKVYFQSSSPLVTFLHKVVSLPSNKIAPLFAKNWIDQI